MNVKSIISDFWYGGNSKAAAFGRLAGVSFRFSVKWGSIVIITLLFVTVGQFGQYMASIKDIRNDAISKWVDDNPMQKKLADTFVSDCLTGKSVTDRGMVTKMVSVYECGRLIGANSLVDAVKEADEVLVTASWPLSLIN